MVVWLNFVQVVNAETKSTETFKLEIGHNLPNQYNNDCFGGGLKGY